MNDMINAPVPDWQALYKAAAANLSSTARERRARDAREKLERQQRAAEHKAAIREEKRKLREWTKQTKAELKEVTKECNRLDRKMQSKKGLTPEEHGAYEELDAYRWELVRQLTNEDWR
jgi:chromosome segregation ATPase